MKKATSLDRLTSMLGSAAAAAEPVLRPQPERGATEGGAPAASLADSGMFKGLVLSEMTRDQVVEAGKLRTLALDEIEPDPNQPRKTFDKDALDELRDTIKAQGILQPPCVRPHPTAPGRYMLIYGERRWRCWGMLGNRFIEVRYEELDDKRALVWQLIENSERARAMVQPWEEAVAFGRLMEHYATQKDLCEDIGHDKFYVSKRLSLLDLPANIRALHDDGILMDLETSLALGRLHQQAPTVCQKVVERAKKAGKIQREWVQAALRAQRAPKAAKPVSSGIDAEFQDFADRLNRALYSRFGTGAELGRLAAPKGEGGDNIHVELVLPGIARLKALVELLEAD